MLAATLITLRTAAGLSQQELARRAGVSQQLIGKLETGKARESRKLPQIAKALGLTAEQLLNWKTDADYRPPAPLTSDTGWPFSMSIDVFKKRWNRLTPGQRMKIEGEIMLLMEAFERDEEPASIRHQEARGPLQRHGG